MQILITAIFIYLTANWRRETKPPTRQTAQFHYDFNYMDNVSDAVFDFWWIHTPELFLSLSGFLFGSVLIKLFFFQVFAVRLWLSLNQWWSSLENLTNWPVRMQEYQIIVLISAGSDKLKEKDWSGLPSFLLRVEPLNIIPHQSRIASPFPETTMWTRCICRWTAWRLKTLLFIIVLDSHSDTGSHRAVQKPLQMSLWQSLIEGALKPLYTQCY